VSLDFSSSPLSLQSVVPSTILNPFFTMAAVDANAGMTAFYKVPVMAPLAFQT